MNISIARVRSISKRLEVTIPAGDTQDVDTIIYNELTTQKYLIEIKNVAGTIFKSLEMSAGKKGSDVTDSIAYRFGDTLNVDVNFLKVGSDSHLRMANNEAFDIVVSVLKFSFS